MNNRKQEATGPEGACGRTGSGLLRPRGHAVRVWLRASADEPAAAVHLLRPAHKEAALGHLLPPPPRVAGCSRYVRRRIAARLPEICEALIERTLAGDLQATKLLWQMAELDGKLAKAAPGKGSRGTGAGFARKALEEFRAR